MNKEQLIKHVVAIALIVIVVSLFGGGHKFAISDSDYLFVSEKTDPVAAPAITLANGTITYLYNSGTYTLVSGGSLYYFSNDTSISCENPPIYNTNVPSTLEGTHKICKYTFTLESNDTILKTKIYQTIYSKEIVEKVVTEYVNKTEYVNHTFYVNKTIEVEKEVPIEPTLKQFYIQYKYYIFGLIGLCVFYYLLKTGRLGGKKK
jgi:hypothetical protein